MTTFAVYQASFRRAGNGNASLTYVGYCSQFKKQTSKQAVLVRRAWHLDPGAKNKPAKWLKNVVSESLRLKVVQKSLGTLRIALIEEARHAAKLLETHADTVRGGPWLRWSLTAADLEEAGLVRACDSRAEVEALAERRPSGSLKWHLRHVMDQPRPLPPPPMKKKPGKSNWHKYTNVYPRKTRCIYRSGAAKRKNPGPQRV